MVLGVGELQAWERVYTVGSKECGCVLQCVAMWLCDTVAV